MLGSLVGVAAEVEKQRRPQFGEWLAPQVEGLASIFEKDGLPVTPADACNLALVCDVNELVAGRFLGLASEVVRQVVAVYMVAVLATVELDALEQLVLESRGTTDGGEGGQPVFVSDDSIENLTGGEFARPADEAGHTVGPSQLEFFSER